jgi:hypothetical protein
MASELGSAFATQRYQCFAEKRRSKRYLFISLFCAIIEQLKAVTWLPVDVAAASLLELGCSNDPVLHLVSPRPTPWNDIVSGFSTHLKNIPIIPAEDWVARLHDVAAKADENGPDAGLILQEHFEHGKFGEGTNLSTKRAVSASPVLANTQPIQKKDLEIYLAYWQKVGFIET